MFLSRNKKNNVYPCKLRFYYIKVGFKGVKIILACFRDGIAVRWSDQNVRMLQQHFAYIRSYIL